MSDLAKLAIPMPEVSLGSAEQGATTKSKPTHIEGRFLRGPIPWVWLTKAAQLSGQELQVGLALWHLNGYKQTGTVKLKPSVVRELGVSRHATYRALNNLESVGLVSVVRKKGSAPTVTLLV